jgi:hypothetical protein
MALIGTRMHGDTLATHSLAIQGKLTHIGIVATTRIAQRSHLIYIYTQFRHTKQKKALSLQSIDKIATSKRK